MSVSPVLLGNGEEIQRCVTKNDNGKLIMKYNNTVYQVEFMEERTQTAGPSYDSWWTVHNAFKVAEVIPDYNDNKIIEARFNNEPTSRYNYKHFDVLLRNGKVETFHYCVSNPMPKMKNIVGLGWEELCSLCQKMFYDKLQKCRRPV